MFTKKTRSLSEFKIYYNSFFKNLCFDNCNWLICTCWSGFLLTRKIYWSIINFYLPIIFVPAWSDNKRNSSADWKKHRNNDKCCSWLFRNIHGDKIVADDGDGGESKNTDLSWFYSSSKIALLGLWNILRKLLKYDWIAINSHSLDKQASFQSDTRNQFAFNFLLICLKVEYLTRM